MGDRWHVFENGRTGKRLKQLPAAAELSGDGRWATVWEIDGNGDRHAVATFVRVDVDQRRRGRPS